MWQDFFQGASILQQVQTVMLVFSPILLPGFAAAITFGLAEISPRFKAGIYCIVPLLVLVAYNLVLGSKDSWELATLYYWIAIAIFAVLYLLLLLKESLGAHYRKSLFVILLLLLIFWFF